MKPTPPKIPETLPELDRAIILLGDRAKGVALTEKRRRELVDLIGNWPDAGGEDASRKLAATWKQSLKALAKALREQMNAKDA